MQLDPQKQPFDWTTLLVSSSGTRKTCTESQAWGFLPNARFFLDLGFQSCCIELRFQGYGPCLLRVSQLSCMLVSSQVKGILSRFLLFISIGRFISYRIPVQGSRGHCFRFAPEAKIPRGKHSIKLVRRGGERGKYPAMIRLRNIRDL
jgi:hypothetical protein